MHPKPLSAARRASLSCKPDHRRCDVRPSRGPATRQTLAFRSHIVLRGPVASSGLWYTNVHYYAAARLTKSWQKHGGWEHDAAVRGRAHGSACSFGALSRCATCWSCSSRSRQFVRERSITGNGIQQVEEAWLFLCTMRIIELSGLNAIRK